MSGGSGGGAVNLVVVGSVALDDIETPAAKKERILGGSVSYACAAASFFGAAGMVGVAGSDFPPDCVELYRSMGIDTTGLQTAKGKTFAWSGVYEEDMNNRRTVSTDLNVFADFKPTLPPSYRDSDYLFLANISPDLQLHVLSELKAPRFVAADTMDLWINTTRADLEKLIAKVNMLLINDSEVRLLAGETNTVRSARKVLEMGPEYVLVKKGEHGAVLFSKDSVFFVPAFPLEEVADPTGAGDTFAGGFMGSIVKDDSVSIDSVRKAMLYGSVIASFGVEAFSLDRLSALTMDEIEGRLAELRGMMGGV